MFLEILGCLSHLSYLWVTSCLFSPCLCVMHHVSNMLIVAKRTFRVTHVRRCAERRWRRKGQGRLGVDRCVFPFQLSNTQLRGLEQPLLARNAFTQILASSGLEGRYCDLGCLHGRYCSGSCHISLCQIGSKGTIEGATANLLVSCRSFVWWVARKTKKIKQFQSEWPISRDAGSDAM